MSAQKRKGNENYATQTPPYLSVFDAATRSPITPFVLVLLLLQQRLYSLQDSVRADCARARQTIAEACSYLEVSATAIVNIPEKLAVEINAGLVQATVTGIKKLEGALTATVDALTNLLTLAIKHYLNTYACLLDFLSAATFGSVQYYADVMQVFINQHVAQITSALSSGLNNINAALVQAQQNGLGALQGFLNGIPGVSVNINAQQVLQLPQVSVELQSIQVIPLDFVNSLKVIQVPSAVAAEAQLLDLMKRPSQVGATVREWHSTYVFSNRLHKCVQILKGEIVTGLSSISLFSSPLPLPPHTERVIICSSNTTSQAISHFEDVLRTSISSLTTGIWILIGAVALVLALSEVLVYWRDRSTKQAIARILDSPNRQSSVLEWNSYVADSIFERIRSPLAYELSTRACMLLPCTRSRTSLDQMEWFVRYVCHPGSLAIISTGILGMILTTIAQPLVSQRVDALRSSLTAEMTDWEDQGRVAIDNAVLSVTRPWADGVNDALSTLENTINNDVSGWIVGVVTPVNTTLNFLTNHVTDGVQAVFGGVPPIEHALSSLFRCLFEAPIRELEQGLATLAQGLSINLPRVNETALAVEAESALAVLTVVRVGVVGTHNERTGKREGGFVGAMEKRYEATLNEDRKFYMHILLFGLIVPVVGFLRIICWLVLDVCRSIGGHYFPRSSDSRRMSMTAFLQDSQPERAWTTPRWIDDAGYWFRSTFARGQQESSTDRKAKISAAVLQFSSASIPGTSVTSSGSPVRGIAPLRARAQYDMFPSSPHTGILRSSDSQSEERSLSSSLLNDFTYVGLRSPASQSSHWWEAQQLDPRVVEQLKRRVSTGKQ
ncbi:plasma membrane fusion protein prm1 [Gonapodya sp. JEL0774]|nr:plasma membrane fusion protein prm1 [Gonapodya sp. JEL0774]